MSIISISVTLLVILASLHFLVKVNAENLGNFYRRFAYLVLIVATTLLLYQIVRGCSRMWNRKMHDKTEQGGYMHHNKQMRNGNRMDDACGQMMDCCRHSGKMERKRMRRNGEPGIIRESTIDTVDGKLLKKKPKL